MKLIALFAVVTLQCFAQAPEQASPPPETAQDWEDLRAQYEDQGYLWIKNYFSKEQAQLIEHWAGEINRAAQLTLSLMQQTNLPLNYLAQNLPGTLIIVPEAKDPLQVCRTEDMLTCYPDLHLFIDGTITTYLGALFHEPYTLFKDKLNYKWPGGGAFDPHQDFPAFSFLGPREHITAMISIDSADEENGCLYVARNWRKTFAGDERVDQEKLEKGTAVLPYVIGGKKHGSIDPDLVEKIDWMPLKTSPGDLVIFSSYLPHYSEPNRSQRSRRAMFFTFNKLSEGEFRRAYYYAKRNDPDNPTFHFATPTKARDKE